MICPKCQKDSISFWKVWRVGGFGNFRCPECEAISQVKKSAPLTIVSIVLGFVAAAVFLFTHSWAAFGIAFVIALAIDALIGHRFRCLALIVEHEMGFAAASLQRRLKNLSAITLLISAALPVGMWGILGFVGSSSCESAWVNFVSFAEYAFSSENPDRLYFVWLAVLPILLVVISGAYFFGVAKQRKGAIALFVASLALTVVSAWLSQAVVIPLLFQLYFGFRCVREAKAVQSL